MPSAAIKMFFLDNPNWPQPSADQSLYTLALTGVGKVILFAMFFYELMR